MIENNFNKLPIVSVIMPAYNAERTCAASIKSVLTQKFDSFELIIVDDGSSDGTFDICKKAAEKDNRIRCIRQSNKGVSSARNAALKIASGKYIAFIDADDQMDICFLHEMVNVLEQENTDIVYCGYTSVSGNRKKVWIPSSDERSLSEMIQYLITENALNMLWNKLFRRKLITNDFNEKISMGEDLQFIIDYHMNVKNYTVICKSLYNYTANTTDSLTKKTDLIITSICNEVYQREKLLLKYRSDIYYARKGVPGYLFYLLSRCNNYNDYNKIFSKIRNNSELLDLIARPYYETNNIIIRLCLLHNFRLVLYLIIRIKKIERAKDN